MTYNFDQRLLNQSFTLSVDNWVDGMLRINGIYYHVKDSSKLSVGDTVLITDIIGNQVIVAREEQ